LESIFSILPKKSRLGEWVLETLGDAIKTGKEIKQTSFNFLGRWNNYYPFISCKPQRPCPYGPGVGLNTAYYATQPYDEAHIATDAGLSTLDWNPFLWKPNPRRQEHQLLVVSS
jgi:hypothetical protein